MTKPPETIRIREPRIACDGSGDIPAALGHPRIWLQVDEKGYVDCGYCDRHFVLIGGPADASGKEDPVRSAKDELRTSA